MTPARLLYLISLNAVMALGSLFGVLAAGEYLIPGFASPFIDVVHLGLVVLAAAVGVVMLKPQDGEPSSIWTRAWQGLMLAAALVGGGYLLWANLNASSLADMALLGAYAILCSIFFIVTLLAL